MMQNKTVSQGPHVSQGPQEISQYLKVSRSSMRFRRLQTLAKLSGCNWQTVALEAIDRLLESELGDPGHHSE